MTGFIIIAVFVLVIFVGQLIRYYFRSKKTYYVIHILGVFVVISISAFASINLISDENWPWWIFALIYIMPILLSIIIGIIQDIVRRTY